MEPLDPPLSNDDHVLRLIYKFHHTKRGGGRFKPDAFGVLPPDTDGLSVFLERPGLASPEALLNSKPNPGDYFVARIPVSALRNDLGLAIDYTPNPTDPVPGHCSLPGLKVQMKDDEATAQLLREEQAKLARLLDTHPEYIIRKPEETPPPQPEAATAPPQDPVN